MTLPVRVVDDLAQIRDLANAVWMAAAELDEPSSTASIRCVVEVVIAKTQAIIDLHKKTPEDFPPPQ